MAAPQTSNNEVRDENVMSFMRQIVQEKHGNQVEAVFLEQEADKLYNEFGDNLVAYFEPMLTNDQKSKFDELINRSADQDALLSFLMDSIENLEQKIVQVLMEFRENYIRSPLNE
ncbi:hypothetical protein JW796_01110 [Candidatus Dojkabacteria bacterium]|nr:hypothetical protein [Candidatus Dojkabacteria bacterium]